MDSQKIRIGIELPAVVLQAPFIIYIGINTALVNAIPQLHLFKNTGEAAGSKYLSIASQDDQNCGGFK